MTLPLLTQSRLRTYRECARLHRLTYVDGWRPVRESEPLGIGRRVHLGLAAWWESRGDLEAALDAAADAAEDPYRSVVVGAMLGGYHDRWIADLARYDVVAVERAFEAPLLNPATMAASRTWRLAGRVDAVVRERATGRVLLVEHKTTADDLAGERYWAKLAMDAQVSHYVLGAEALGYQVQGCLYDVLRRPGQRPLKATPVEARKFTKDGRLYAAQRLEDEGALAYGERVAAAVAADLASHYARREVPRTEDQVRDYLHDAWDLGRSIREADLAGRAPRNPDACHRFGECAFWRVCAYGVDPVSEPGTWVRTDPHPELAETPAGGGGEA